MNQNKLTQEEELVLRRYLQDAPYIQCPHCKSNMFNEARKFKKISKLISGTENDVLAPVPVLYCVSCYKELLLDDLNSESKIIN